MQLFRGYVKTKNKKCVEKFKDVENLRPLENAKTLPEYAGILDLNTILIDVDDEKQSELLFKLVQSLELKCQVRKTTRGMHFYFLNFDEVTKCRTDCSLPIGINADIKVGNKNSYAILKFNNKEREILYDSEEYEVIPTFLRPLRRKSTNFSNVDEGDGRNSKLFAYILTLQKNKFSVEEIKECISLINQYILPTALSEEELEVILRDDAFTQADTSIWYEGKTFLHEEFAKALIDSEHIKIINNQIHFYNEGIYDCDERLLQRKMLKMQPGLRQAQRKEVLSSIFILAEEVRESSERYIAFRNGIYDIYEKQMLPFSPDTIVKNKINYNYNPNAYDELMDHTLNRLSCNDEEIRALIEEMVGYCFYRRNEMGKAFILTGDKSNGKSTLLAVIERMLGYNSIASLDLKELGDRFKTAELFGKLANIGDDIGDEFIADTAVFKKLVTGDRVNVEKKGQDPFEFNPYCKLIFSANNIPRMRDKTGAVQRRLIIIPFHARFSKSDPDFRPFIKKDLCQDEPIEYLISLGVEALHDVLECKSFTTSKKVEKELEDFEKSNNPILLFFDELNKDEIVGASINEVYKKYTAWTIENGFTRLTNRMFGKEVVKFYDVKSKVTRIGNKTIRIYD